MKLSTGLALGVAVSCFSMTAAAQSPEPTADQIRVAAEAFDQGKAAFKHGDYVEAAEHFEKADSQAPSAPAIDLAMRSRERANQLDRAATLAALAIERHPDKQPLQEYAAGLLQRADAELYKLTVSCSTPCDLIVDTKIVHGAAATERVVYLQPGAFTLKAGWPGGRTRSEKINASAGGAAEASFEEPAVAGREPSEAETSPDTSAIEARLAAEAHDDGNDPVSDEKSKGWSPTVFWVGAGLTAAAGAITLWSGIDTVNNPGKDKVERDCVGQGEACPTYQEGLDKETRTNALLGVTAGLGLATILIGAFATDWGNDKADSSSAASKPRTKARGLWATPWVGVGNGAMLGASGRF